MRLKAIALLLAFTFVSIAQGQTTKDRLLKKSEQVQKRKDRTVTQNRLLKKRDKSWIDAGIEAQSAAKFTGIRSTDKALEVATATYTKDGFTVDVHGAIHIADTEFFVQKNIAFETYTKVLYELVMDESMKAPPKAMRKEGSMYNIFSQLLELADQQKVVRYDRPNFVHADMTKQEMQVEMRKGGDDMMTLMGDAIVNMMRTQNKKLFVLQDSVATGDITVAEAREELGAAGAIQEINMMDMLFDPDRAIKMKRLFSQIAQEQDENSFGPVVGGYLIKDRNAKCIEVLERELKGAKKGDTFAIFYGAGHMNGLDRRLKEMGFERTSVKWQTAWDLE